MRITVLARGGLAVYGGHYDPHNHEAIAMVRDGETVTVTISYPSTPSAITTASTGAAATTPTISGTTASFTLSSMQDGGCIDVTATVAGATVLTRIRAAGQVRVDGYDGGSGPMIPAETVPDMVAIFNAELD